MIMAKTQLPRVEKLAAKRFSRRPLGQIDRGIARVLAGGLLLGATLMSSTLALAAPRPVAIDVTVTGTDGDPVSGAIVSVTQIGASPVSSAAAIGGDGITGPNGTASVNRGAATPDHAPQLLPAGVYQVDVSVDGTQTTTYINVPEGQVGAPKIDLGTALAIDWSGPGYAEAAAAASAAARAGERATYDAAVARIDEIIAFRDRANDDLARAVEQFRRSHDIPADDLSGVGKLLDRFHEIETAAGTHLFPRGPVEDYRHQLELLALWRNAVTAMQQVRASILSFPHPSSAGTTDTTEFARLDWL